MIKLIFLITCLSVQVLGFSIPGISIKNYKDKDSIPVFANELDSVRTQINYDYYYLNFCGKENSKPTEETLGSALLGESTQTTDYEIYINNNEDCKSLCTRKIETEDYEKFIWMIDKEYHANLVLDNLPALLRPSEFKGQAGFPVGFVDGTQYYINNHITFLIELYQIPNTDLKRIGNFTVIPRSLKPDDKNAESAQPFCENNHEILESSKINSFHWQKLELGEIMYSYDVKFHTSATALATRWDHYKHLGTERVHWFSVSNPALITLVLTTIFALILKRTVGKDIRMYNEVDLSSQFFYYIKLPTTEDILEDRGWKQLSRDVFRSPKNPLFLSVFLGTGVQVGSMFFLSLLFTIVGFIDKNSRGNLITAMILLYNFMGAFAGYFSARYYKMFNGANWMKCILATALFYPGINFLIFDLINIMLEFEESSSALSFSTIATLMALWFGISIPLVFLGGFIGYKKRTIQNPCKVNPVPKFVPAQPWYLNRNLLCLLGGLIPFGVVFIELFSIMNSIWGHSFYYLFAFLFGVILILIITCAEISIVITYLQLCNGVHQVWWRSFFTTGSIALYIFGYSILYYAKHLQISSFASTMLYFGYMLAISIAFFIFCGTIGFFASYWFARKVYSSIRID